MPGTAPARVALVTGCSTGIGAATARRFIERGWTTVATARDPATLADLAALGCEVDTLDVRSDEDRRRVVAAVLARHGRVDALVNNAGYAAYGALEEVDLDRWRDQFETNVFGLVALTQLVLPGMRERRAGRIINISSMGGIITLPLGAAYHASKFAVEALSDVVRAEVVGFGIRVVVVEPGAVLTAFGGPAGAGLNLDEASPYGAMSRKFAVLLGRTYARRSLITFGPERVARVIVRAASSSHPRARYRVGVQARGLIVVKRLAPSRLYDALVRAPLR